MFAIIKSGGKQYKVSKDTVLKVEKLENKPGDKIKFENVLLVFDGNETKIGSPNVDGTIVHAEILDQTKDRKIIVFKKKRRKNYRRKKGHKQHVTILKILSIETNQKKSSNKG